MYNVTLELGSSTVYIICFFLDVAPLTLRVDSESAYATSKLSIHTPHSGKMLYYCDMTKPRFDNIQFYISVDDDSNSEDTESSDGE